MKKVKATGLKSMYPRFQPIVYKYLNKRNLTVKYSSFSIVGEAIGVIHNKFNKWHTDLIENLATSIRIHKINKSIAINHKDYNAVKIVEPNQVTFNEININISAFKKLKKY